MADDDAPRDNDEGDASIDDDESYETDTDADENDAEGSSSERGSSEEEDSEEEEEHWSVRVRLLSAVDLPPSLSPTVPLCPWFKFGLVEDVNVALDEINEADRKRRASELEISEGGEDEGGEEKEKIKGKRTLRPRGVDDSEHDAEEESSDSEEGDDDVNKARELTKELINEQQQQRRSSSENNTSNMNTSSRLLTTLPPQSIRSSTSKIMSRNAANVGGGNGADWNEEYRWDELISPMEGCLVVKLCTRLGAQSDVGGGMGGSSRNLMGPPGMSTSMSGDYGDANSDVSTGYLDSEGGESTYGGLGIRGLWRKGREQLEEHRRRSTIAGGAAGGGTREEKAAAVAQFLMRGQSASVVVGDDGATAATASATTTGGRLTGPNALSASEHGLNQNDLVDHQQRWSESKSQSDVVGEYDVALGAGDGARRRILEQSSDPDDDCHHAEGLCLGTLSIPLSRLPLVLRL